MKRCILLILVSTTFAAMVAAKAQTVQHFSVYSADASKIGTLTATTAGDAVIVKFAVRDNGRGPQTTERMVVGANGLPLSWSITGTSYAGGQVDERFTLVNGSAVWDGPAERGSAENAKDKLYVAAAGSPWALALYARYAVKQPGGKIDILPAGSMRAQKRDSYNVGESAKRLDVDLYMVDGMDLNPDFILLEKNGELFAHLGDQLLLRDGYESEIAHLNQIYADQVKAVQAEFHLRLAHRIRVPWSITNVRVFDPPSQTLGPLSTVSVFDNRIVRVTPGKIDIVAHGEELVNGAGGTLMPGLVDMHAHEEGWQGLDRLAAGVTTIRDMGNDNDSLLEKHYQRRIQAQDGPRIVRAGLVDGKSPWTAHIGISVGSLDEARNALHWYADRNYPFLKIYNGMNPDWIKPLASEAHSLDMRVIGHIPAFTTADQMIEAGYDEVTHLNQLMLQYVLKPGEDTRTPLRLTAMHRFAYIDLHSSQVRHTIELMKSHHVGLDTTAAAMERLNIQRDGVTPLGDALYLDHMPMMFQRNRRRTFLEIPDKKTDDEHFRARDKIIDMMALLHSEGIKLWPGTDDGVAYTLHRELVLFGEAGIPAPEVLKIDCYDSLEHLGLSADLGVIARGKLADFILIPGDPTKDLSILRNVNMVVKEGIIYFPEEIYGALNIKPFSTSPLFVHP